MLVCLGGNRRVNGSTAPSQRLSYLLTQPLLHEFPALAVDPSPGVSVVVVVVVMVWLLFQVAHGALSDGALDAAETQKELLGASGLMLLLPPKVRSEDAVEEDVYWLAALLQIKQLLQAKPFRPALPLVVLVPSPGGDAEEKEVEDGVWRQPPW